LYWGYMIERELVPEGLWKHTADSIMLYRNNNDRRVFIIKVPEDLAISDEF